MQDGLGYTRSNSHGPLTRNHSSSRSDRHFAGSLAAGLGTLAGVIVLALYDIKHREETRRVAIREKAAEVAEERASINELVARPVFIQQEEETGTPEKNDNQ